MGDAVINGSNLLFPENKDAMIVIEWIFLFPMLGEVALGIWILVFKDSWLNSIVNFFWENQFKWEKIIL